MIEIKNLTKVYGEKAVLNIEHLEIADGEFVALMGHNGSGKSTFIKILAGIIEKTQGKITGTQNVLYLPQQCLAFDKSVKKNIMYAMQGDKKAIEQKCDEILSALQLEHLKDKNAKSLSGGELQRLCLARLLVKDCSLLILDEPCSATDEKATAIIEKAILDYQGRTNCSVIMVTHSLEQAQRTADRIIRLKDGVIEETGETQ